MPDIAMCSNFLCPVREFCYRYRAHPNDYQSYADFKPSLIYKDGEVKAECDGMWDVENRKDLKDTKEADKQNKKMGIF